MGSPLFYQFLNMSNIMLQSKEKKQTVVKNTNVEYEAQFKKNLELLKEKFRKDINPILCFDEVLKCTEALKVLLESTNK